MLAELRDAWGLGVASASDELIRFEVRELDAAIDRKQAAAEAYAARALELFLSRSGGQIRAYQEH
jgi:hypothetical protein